MFRGKPQFKGDNEIASLPLSPSLPPCLCFSLSPECKAACEAWPGIRVVATAPDSGWDIWPDQSVYPFWRIRIGIGVRETRLTSPLHEEMSVSRLSAALFQCFVVVVLAQFCFSVLDTSGLCHWFCLLSTERHWLRKWYKSGMSVCHAWLLSGRKRAQATGSSVPDSDGS